MATPGKDKPIGRDDEVVINDHMQRHSAAQRLLQGVLQILKQDQGTHVLRVSFYVDDKGNSAINTWYVVDAEVDDSGMPKHLPMGLTIDGQGPVAVDDDEFHHWGCWCGDSKCEEFWRQGPV